MNFASSLARNAIAWAISSTCASLPSGWELANPACASRLSGHRLMATFCISERASARSVQLDCADVAGSGRRARYRGVAVVCRRPAAGTVAIMPCARSATHETLGSESPRDTRKRTGWRRCPGIWPGMFLKCCVNCSTARNDHFHKSPRCGVRRSHNSSKSTLCRTPEFPDDRRILRSRSHVIGRTA